MSDSDPAVMTIDEVAELLRVPKSSIYRLAQRGEIPSRKVGRHWRFHRETLEQWLKERHKPQESPDENQ